MREVLLERMVERLDTGTEDYDLPFSLRRQIVDQARVIRGQKVLGEVGRPNPFDHMKSDSGTR